MFLYGSACWTLTARFLRAVAGYGTTNHERN